MSRIATACAALTCLAACDGGLDAEPARVATAHPPGHTLPTDPSAPIEGESAEPVAPAPSHAELPFLLSRYGPTQGIIGTRVTLLTAFWPDGCGATGDCAVTIAGLPAPIVEDESLLVALVPEFATSGPLCLTWRGRSECGEVFTVLDRPLLYGTWPDRAAVGARDLALTLTGDGFMPDSEVWLDGEVLTTTYYSAQSLAAVLPTSILDEAGVRALVVYSPSSGRCGAQSEPVSFTVTP